MTVKRQLPPVGPPFPTETSAEVPEGRVVDRASPPLARADTFQKDSAQAALKVTEGWPIPSPRELGERAPALAIKRTAKSAAYPRAPDEAAINRAQRDYATAAADYARVPSPASKATLDEAKGRLDADLSFFAAALDALEPGSKTYKRAEARYQGWLIKRAQTDHASYRVVYERAIKCPADKKAQVALAEWRTRADEGLTLVGNYLHTLPAGSEEEHRLVKALEAVGANYKGIEARAQLDADADEPFVKGTREDALLQKRFRLASRWLGREVNQGHLEHYAVTGELTAGLEAAFSRARTGDAVFGGIMTEAQLARAGYLKKKKEKGTASSAELKEIPQLESGVKQYRGARKDVALDYADAQRAAGERLRALPPEQQTERSKAQAARYFKVAERTYASIDADARAELATGQHKADSRAARLAARATNGWADVKLSVAEAQRAEEARRFEANLANPITSLVQAYVGSVPKVSTALAKDTRSQDAIAHDAMTPQPEGGRSIEAMRNEAESLDQRLKTSPEQRRKRRELLKTRIDATEQYQAFSIASAKSLEEAEQIRDSGRLGLLEDNHELRTRSTADLETLRTKFSPATRTSEQQGLIEAALNDEMLATESLAKERQEAQRAVAMQPTAEAMVRHAELDLADWQREYDTFQATRAKRFEDELAAHKVAIRYVASHPEPKGFTEAEDKALADLQARKKTLDENLPRTKAQQQKLATDISQYDESWRTATGSKKPIASAAELYAEQMESTHRLGAEINSPELAKNKHLSGLERTEIKARHAGRTADLWARKAQAKHQYGVIKKLAAEGERELSSVERRRWKTISKNVEEIEDKAHDRAWDKLEEMGKARDLLIARSGKEGYEQLTGEKADVGLSVRVSYTSDEENKLAQYKAQMRPHIDGQKAQEAKARALEAEGDKEQVAAATDYLQAKELAEQSEALRAAYAQAERAEAASKRRDVDQDKLDQLASDSVQTFARVSGSGAAIDPTASTALLKRSRDVVAAELPVLDAGSTETKRTRLSRRAFLNDFVGMTADGNRAAIAAPPRRENAWKENADAYVDLTFIGIEAGKDVVKDAPAGSEQSVRADARVKKLEALVEATPALNQVSKSGIAAANSGVHRFQAHAESSKNEMTQDVRAASGGLIGRVWTMVADPVTQDTIGDAINVTEDQYDNSVDGAQHTRARYAGLFALHDAAAKADYRTRVQHRFWLADPAADKRDPVGAVWREAGKARFVTDKALTSEKSFTQATLLWSHADPARQAWTRGHAADDFDGLAEIYARPDVADAMYASHYQTLNEKHRLLSHHLKTTVEDNFLIKAAYTGANIYTTYLVSKLAGRVLARVPGFNLLDKLMKYGTGQVARGVAAAGLKRFALPFATGLMGGLESYAMLTLNEHALKHAEKRWGIKPGSDEYDALNLALGGMAMSAQLNIARTNRAFYNEFRVVVGMQVGPPALAKVLDLCPEDEAWLTKWTGVFLPATLSAIAARAQRRSAPEHAELISKHTGIGDEQTSRAVQKLFANDRFLGEFDRIDSTRDVARRRRYVEKKLTKAGVNPDTAKHVAARDAYYQAERLLPPLGKDATPRQQKSHDEARNKKLVESGLSEADIALANQPSLLEARRYESKIYEVLASQELEDKHGQIDSPVALKKRHEFVLAKLMVAGVPLKLARDAAAGDALRMAIPLVPEPTADGISQRTRGYYDELVELMDEAGVPHDLALSVAEAEAFAMLIDAQRAAETELARQRAAEALGKDSPSSPAAKIDGLMMATHSAREKAEGHDSKPQKALGEERKPSWKVDLAPPDPKVKFIAAGEEEASAMELVATEVYGDARVSVTARGMKMTTVDGKPALVSANSGDTPRRPVVTEDVRDTIRKGVLFDILLNHHRVLRLEREQLRLDTSGNVQRIASRGPWPDPHARARVGEPLQPTVHSLAIAAALEKGDFHPKNLLQALSTIPGIAERYAGSAGVSEGYTVGRHTEMVLAQFERYFAQQELPHGISTNLMRMMLALHDIGKAGATQQHHATKAVIAGARRHLPLTDAEMRILNAVIEDDPLGQFLQHKLTTDETCALIRGMAERSGLSLNTFFRVLTLYYQSDIASYTRDAGGVASLDRLFESDGQRFAIDEKRGRLAFNPSLELRFATLVKALGVADSAEVPLVERLLAAVGYDPTQITNDGAPWRDLTAGELAPQLRALRNLDVDRTVAGVPPALRDAVRNKLVARRDALLSAGEGVVTRAVAELASGKAMQHLLKPQAELPESFPLTALHTVGAGGANGQTFVLDGGGLEGMRLRMLRAMEGTTPTVELSFRLTPARLERLMARMKTLGGEHRPIEFTKVELGVTRVRTDERLRLVQESTAKAGQRFVGSLDERPEVALRRGGAEIAVVGETGQAAARGLVRIQLRGDDAECAEQLRKLAREFELEDCFAPADAQVKRRLLLLDLLRQYDYNAWRQYANTDIGTIPLDHLARQVIECGIGPAELSAMSWQAGAPGYQALFNPQQEKDVLRLGIRHLTATVGDVVAVVTSGFKSSLRRLREGILTAGISPMGDFQQGSADNVFVRIVKNSFLSTGSGYARTSILIDPRILGRTDWHANIVDNFGAPSGEKGLETLRQVTHRENLNEVMFRDSIDPRPILKVVCEDDDNRVKLINALKDAGFKPASGEPLETFVVVSRTFVDVGPTAEISPKDLAAYIASFMQGDPSLLELLEQRRGLAQQLRLTAEERQTLEVALIEVGSPEAFKNYFDQTVLSLDADALADALVNVDPRKLRALSGGNRTSVLRALRTQRQGRAFADALISTGAIPSLAEALDWHSSRTPAVLPGIWYTLKQKASNDRAWCERVMEELRKRDGFAKRLFDNVDRLREAPLTDETKAIIELALASANGEERLRIIARLSAQGASTAATHASDFLENTLSSWTKR